MGVAKRKSDAKLTPMMEQYFTMKESHRDALLFFRLGDFYELFFDDALLVSELLGLTLTSRGTLGNEPIPMCGVPYHAADTYIEQLIGHGYKVAICEQVENPKTAKGVVRREVVRIVTPGTWLGYEDKRNNYICSLFYEKERFFLVAGDFATGELELVHQPLSLDGLLDECMRYRPSEIVYPSLFPSHVRQELERHFKGLMTVVSSPDANRCQQLLNAWLIQKPSLPPAAEQAIGQLLEYWQSTQKRVLQHFQLSLVEPAQYLRMDGFTVRNLELFERLSGEKKGTLLHLMDRTATMMGARRLRQWLAKPLVRRQDIEQRLDAVSELVADALIREDIRLKLRSIADLERIATRIAMGTATPKDLLALKDSLAQVPPLKSCCQSANTPTLRRLASQLDPCEDVYQLIERAIDPQAPAQFQEGRVIRDGYDAQLDELRQVARQGKDWLVQLEAKERERTGIKSLKIGFHQVFGYYIEVTKANLSLVPHDRYHRKQTLANAERYVTEELKERERLILEAEEKLAVLEHQRFDEVREQVARQTHRLQSLARHLGVLDVYATFAEISVQRRYVRPELTEEPILEIVDGRHPVVEQMLPDGRFVANDTHMDEHSRIYLITGPNMAGKSTYMRQVALMAIMAQMGCFVPATRARLPIFDQVFTRIGASDDLASGQSTFMVEMNEIRLTTTQATKDSLVIIDELGRGTSTEDGMAIARAVIEYVHDQIGCFAFVSTHYHELASLEGQLPGLKNVSMAVEETDTEVLFLRRLVEGPTNKSYGIYCAKLAGLPSSIIQRAEELLAAGPNLAATTGDRPSWKSAGVRESVPAAAVGQADLDAGTVEHFQQLSFFAEPDDAEETLAQQIIAKLKQLDLDRTTPLDALKLLYQWKRKGGWV